ncbi:MAG: STAS-like domain-containing protein [Verrucomicrobiota bacterium]|nr:STAS-like domain-containing protein [Verrucomicrobiota bacterium]
MIELKIFPNTGAFAENKDMARELRLNQLMPALKKGEDVLIDFADVRLSTQSFVHALISDAIRVHGIEVLDNISFKNCNQTLQTLINIVADYMQTAIEENTEIPEDLPE